MDDIMSQRLGGARFPSSTVVLVTGTVSPTSLLEMVVIAVVTVTVGLAIAVVVAVQWDSGIVG